MVTISISIILYSGILTEFPFEKVERKIVQFNDMFYLFNAQKINKINN